MKMILAICIIIASVVFTSCRSSDKKSDAPADTIQEKLVDTVSVKLPPKETPVKAGTAKLAEPRNSSGNPGKNDILAHIDKYLVSTAAYPDPGTVVIKNTFNDVTVQKAILEVTLLNANGAEVRLDYYIVNNIDPGDSKTIKITGSAAAVSASCHVVKLKSNELTAGETIIVGSKYTPK